MSQREDDRPAGRVNRRFFLRSAALSAAALGLLGCSSAAPPSPAAKPTEAAKPAAPAAAAPTTAPAAAAKPAPAAASPAAAAAKPAEGQPQPGGELVFVVSAEPPSFDAHRETTFAMLHPTAPHYSLLVRFDPDQYPKVVPDLAESWTISDDKLTYTFKIRDGVKFHDGSTLTSKDVKASYDHIITPPQGVVSARQSHYAAVESVSAPDAKTVVFKLKYPSAAMLALLASPWNYIYKADLLEKDPHYFEKNVMGTGPFVFGSYTPGSEWTGKKFPDYWDKGKPYLDSFRAIFIKETAAQVAAVRGGRALIEFRGFTPTARDELKQALGDKIVVEEGPWISNNLVAINTKKKPFDDVRVRKALNLAVDRWQGAEALAKITFIKPVGALMRPGSPFAMSDADLTQLQGFGRDGSAAKEQAKQLLKEAGVPDGFSFVLKNRNISAPYEPVGVFLIDQWRKIGLNVTQEPLENTAYFNDLRSGNYDLCVDFIADYMDEPDLQLAKFLSASKNDLNYSGYDDPTLDDLYEKQSRETDPEKRKQLVWQFEKRVVDEMAYFLTLPWWLRIVPHWATLKGYRLLPSHYLNQDLGGLWIAK